jgi:hypothetical protein
VATGHIRVNITLRNQTDRALTLRGSHFDHGDWTPPWNPPPAIAPGADAEFRSEGATISGQTPTTGVDGWVRYGIDGQPAGADELYVHWDSPLIESQYGNTYDEQCPHGFELAHTGGQGHEATPAFTLRQTRPRLVHGFAPSRNGFRFSNRAGAWSKDLPVMTVGYLFHRLLDALPDPVKVLQWVPVGDDFVPLTHADQGLCGGMALATKDYFEQHELPPDRTDNPTSVDDPLFAYLRDRLLESFDITGGGGRYLLYQAPAYPDGDEGIVQATGIWLGRAWVSYREEWPKIKAEIDAGHLSPVALVQRVSWDPGDLGNSHQVLAYGYEQSSSTVVLYICDSNEPLNDHVRLRFDTASTTGRVAVQRATERNPNWQGTEIRCFFRTDGYRLNHGPAGRPDQWRQRAGNVSDAVLARQGVWRPAVLPADLGGTRPMRLRARLSPGPP